MHLSMSQMDSGMKSAPMNGNVDHDFASMMMPHHQGAIDMAKAELIYGKDFVMRRLAEEIVVDRSKVPGDELLQCHPRFTVEGLGHERRISEKHRPRARRFRRRVHMARGLRRAQAGRL